MDTHRYSAGAKWLHWLIALAVLGLIGVGLVMTEMKMSPQKLQLYMNHKSMGLTVLFLMGVRLIYRWRRPPPPLPETMPRWQRLSAHYTHVALYVVLFAMPISGWLMNGASGFPMKYFHLFRVPDLIGKSNVALEFFKTTHQWLAYTLILLISLHILAALKHALIDRDGLIWRMLPFGNSSKKE